jgi:hypothetical protein
MKEVVEGMPEYGEIGEWHPDKARCYDCQYFSVEWEPRDYAPPLFCGIVCLAEGKRYEDGDGSGFPFDPAPAECIESGQYQLDIEPIFWTSSFADIPAKTFEETEKQVNYQIDELLFWLENIKAVGLRP